MPPLKRRGNPTWYRGMPSANPKGRPRGQTSLAVFNNDPDRFFNRRCIRWHHFCFNLGLTLGNGAKAARLAGYSPKSARFIASRLRKKAVIREALRRIGKMIDGSRNLGDGLWLIPDWSGKPHFYRKNNIDKSQHFLEVKELSGVMKQV